MGLLEEKRQKAKKNIILNTIILSFLILIILGITLYKLYEKKISSYETINSLFIIASLVFLILVFWALFKKQKKLDEINQNSKKEIRQTSENLVFKSTMKYFGITMTINVVIFSLFSALSLFFGINLLLNPDKNLTGVNTFVGIGIIIMGIACGLIVWRTLKLRRTYLSGRLY